MATNREHPGWYLAEWREIRGKTQDELAAALKTNRGQISALELGIKRYNRDWVERLAAELRCTPGELVGVNPYGDQPLWSLWAEVPTDKKPVALDMLSGLAKKRA